MSIGNFHRTSVIEPPPPDYVALREDVRLETQSLAAPENFEDALTRLERLRLSEAHHTSDTEINYAEARPLSSFK